MTIQAQLHEAPAGGSSFAERPTTGLGVRHKFVVDGFSMLDHRTRSRAIPLELAPAGRYLSIEHHDEAHLIPLDRPITHIGRGLAADMRLDDPHVSRRHAIVAVLGDRVRVLDDRSANGTFVNGRLVSLADLSDGDVVRVGRVAFRYVEIDVQIKPPPVRRVAFTLPPRRRGLGIAAA